MAPTGGGVVIGRTTDGAALAVRGLKHRLADRTVVALESLQVAPGEVCAVTGANGSGKSTLLRILALLLRPTTGALEVLGESAWPTVDGRGLTARRLRREVTLMHQRPVLFDRDVASNVGFGLKARGVERGEAQRRVEAALEHVGLSAFGRRRARELSGGEAQRVVLARALVLQTPILLLDEPFSYLDEQTRPLLLDLVRERREAGASVLVATHDPGQLDGLADREIALPGSGELRTTQ